jgi:CBS domain-containing protein
MPYARATSIAVSIGQSMAWLLGLWGVLTGNFFLLILAVFVYMAAGQEGRYTQVRNVLSGVLVRQAFARRALTLDPSDPVSRAVDATLQSFQSDFAVCDGEQVVGLLTAGDLVKALQQHQEAAPVSQVMRREFPVASPGEHVFDVQQRMAQAQVGAVPVIDQGIFVGMLTAQDIGELYKLLSVSPQLLGQRAA